MRKSAASYLKYQKKGSLDSRKVRKHWLVLFHPYPSFFLKRVLTSILSWDSFLQVEYENHESPCVYLVGKRRGKCYEGGRGKKGFWRITKEGARGALARIKSSTCGPHRSKTKPSISMPFNLLTWTPFPLFLLSSYAILFVFRRFIPNRPFDPSQLLLNVSHTWS